MNRIFLLLALVAGCATDEPEYQCETDCPRPDDVVQDVDDLKKANVLVSAFFASDSATPGSTRVTLSFDYAVPGLRVPGCPVLDPGLQMSLAGVPGHITQGGGAYRGARWQCGAISLEFTPGRHDPSATLLISDDTGELSLDLGDALVERSVEAVSDPDWTFTDGQAATFRWSPASDVAASYDIGIAWYAPSGSVLPTQPITHVDDRTFTVPLPPGAGTSLWFSPVIHRGCGESNCTLNVFAAVTHPATLTPP